MRASWLVSTSSLYFQKERSLRHTSTLLRYNAFSLRHQYERAQFTIHFIKEIKNLFLYIVELYKHLGFLRTLEKCEKHSPTAHASLALLLKNPACLYNSPMHSARFLFL